MLKHLISSQDKKCGNSNKACFQSNNFLEILFHSTFVVGMFANFPLKIKILSFQFKSMALNFVVHLFFKKHRSHELLQFFELSE